MLGREGSFAKQQQVATKLQRLSGPEEPYVWWIICSLVLQARAAVQGTSGPHFIPVQHLISV